MQQVKNGRRGKRIVALGAVMAVSTLLCAFQPASAQVLETGRASVNSEQALLTGGTSWGQGGPHEHADDGDFYSGKSALLRSHEGDAALNDGSPYTGGSAGTLFDSAPGTDDDDPYDWDYLVFWPKDGRRLVLSSDFVDGDASTQGNQPLVCEEGSYLFFGRFSGDRDWVEELSTVGDSTTGDASFQCWIDDPSSPGTEHRFYDINWYGPVGTFGQCVTYSRTEDKTLRFEAPPATTSLVTGLPISQGDGCPAEIFLGARTKEDDPQTPSEYTYARQSLGYESAPMQLTVTFAGKFL